MRMEFTYAFNKNYWVSVTFGGVLCIIEYQTELRGSVYSGVEPGGGGDPLVPALARERRLKGAESGWEPRRS